MIADSMVGLKRAALSGFITMDGLLSMLAPPNLPMLEQLAYIEDNYDGISEQQAVATGLRQVRPTLSVVVEETRDTIPFGFVGACLYEY
jgi:hypothetical protein